MPLRFLLDEHLRGGGLWQAIQKHNAQGHQPLDVVRVGDPGDLPLGSSDGDILLWAERENRLLISWDATTLSGHLVSHLKSGHHSPGILILPKGSRIPDLVVSLELVAYAGDPANYRDRVVHI